MYASVACYFPSGSSNLHVDNKLVQSDPTPNTDLVALHEKLKATLEDIRSKRSKLTVLELRRLLYRCAAVLMSLDRVSFFLLRIRKKSHSETHETSAIMTYCITWSSCPSRLPRHQPSSSPSRFGAGSSLRNQPLRLLS